MFLIGHPVIWTSCTSLCAPAYPASSVDMTLVGCACCPGSTPGCTRVPGGGTAANDWRSAESWRLMVVVSGAINEQINSASLGLQRRIPAPLTGHYTTLSVFGTSRVILSPRRFLAMDNDSPARCKDRITGAPVPNGREMLHQDASIRFPVCRKENAQESKAHFAWIPLHHNVRNFAHQIFSKSPNSRSWKVNQSKPITVQWCAGDIVQKGSSWAWKTYLYLRFLSFPWQSL